MRSVVPSFLLWAVAACAAAQSNPGALPAGAVLIEPAEVAADEQAKAADVDQAVKAAQADGDARTLAAMLDPAATEPVAWEWRTQRTLDLLRTGARVAAAEPALEALARYAPRVYVRHPETAADYFVPMFDLAGRAAGTLALWRCTGSSQRAKLVAALASRELAAWRKTLAAADGSTRLHLVAAAPSVLAYRDARALLESLLDDPALASTALAALARTWPADAAVAALLDAKLGDPALGATAAALLARRTDAAHVAALQAELATVASPVAQRHLLLALRLIGAEAAKTGAQVYRSRADADPKLAAEVASW